MNKEEILNDYRIAYQSRLASLLGRKEVLTGKAKFGIFGDGKELPQIAMAKYFKKGDFRSGYYRDQTFMMASELLTVQAFFAQLYAHTDIEAEPASAGRMMNGHFGTRLLDEQGNWLQSKHTKNSSSDISPTAAQMVRLVGLALASKYYRANKDLIGENNFKKGIQNYYAKYFNANTTTDGFRAEMENASGKDLKLFFKQWLYQPVNPTINASWTYNVSTRKLNVHLSQVQQFLYNVPVEIGYYIKGSTTPTILTINLKDKDQEFSFPLMSAPEKLELDPRSVLLNDGKMSKE
jgi:hypothetical protein